MKTAQKGWFLGVFLIFGSWGAFAQQPTTVDVPIRKAYLPKGFDNNDNVQLIVEGEFRNSCYKVGATRVEVEPGVIKIFQSAYHYHGTCLHLMVYYNSLVNVGILKAGTYLIKDGSNGEVLGTLPVKVAQSANADDYLYAPVHEARMASGPTTLDIQISGMFTDNCFQFKEIKTQVEGDVIDVLPVVIHENRPHCHGEFFPFKKVIRMEKPPTGRYLVHVRSLEGLMVGRLYSID